MASPPTPDFADLIARLAVGLEAKRIPFMLIGGQAVLLHGEPRLTQDVDVTMGVGPDRIQDLLGVCEALGLQPLPAAIPVVSVASLPSPPCPESRASRPCCRAWWTTSRGCAGAWLPEPKAMDRQPAEGVWPANAESPHLPGRSSSRVYDPLLAPPKASALIRGDLASRLKGRRCRTGARSQQRP
jgi:hypothetical protein